MKTLSTAFEKLWEKAIIFISVFCALIPVSPANMQSSYRDSGVFLYFGWRILNGELPYRDIWDHKPPIIYYINALGLALTNDSRWGVWLIEFFAILFAAALGYYLIKNLFGVFPALISLVLWLVTLIMTIQGGNLTTEYTIPLQFAALWLIYNIEDANYPHWHSFVLGIIGALAFFTKQTTIGIWIVIIFYLLFRLWTSVDRKRWVKEIILLVVGFGLITIGVVAFFGFQGSLNAFWNEVFVYNFVYSSVTSGPFDRIAPVISGIIPLTKTGFFQIALMGYIIGFIMLIYKKGNPTKWNPLLILCLIDLPVELILVSVSGHIYGHYYMVLLPLLCFFASVFLWSVNEMVTSWTTNRNANKMLLIGFIGILLWGSIYNIFDRVTSFNKVNNDEVIEFITSNTNENEKILLWGAETGINFFAKRESPTRFVYLYPLYLEGYADQTIIEEFLNDIIQNPPQLIIDTKDPSTPLFRFPIETKTINMGVDFLKTHYIPVTDIGPWTVYKIILPIS